MWLWVVAGFGAISGAWALWSVRRLRRRVTDLSQQYWELHYDLTRLRSRVARLDEVSPPPPLDRPAGH